jgi:8-oxo-dGTP pyrophosphatase MutT (NUDIX family)
MARLERSAGFVIYRTSPQGTAEYLLLDYGRHWDFPKGHLENDENDLAAARRELQEETGITDVQVAPDFHHEITYYFRDRKKGLIRKTVAFFLGETHAKSDAIVLSHEHEAFVFLPFEAAIRHVTYPNAKQVLKLAHEKLNGKRPSQSSSDSLSPGETNVENA